MLIDVFESGAHKDNYGPRTGTEDMPDGTYARSGDASFTPEAVLF